MQETELALRRRQMGLSVQVMAAANAPRGLGRIGDGYWLMLTGEPRPDVNLALVYTADVGQLESALLAVEASGAPTLLAVAGPATGTAPGAGWELSGAMPFMACELAGQDLRADDRVRRAGGADFDVVTGLLAEAFAMSREAAGAAARVLSLDDRSGLEVWLLEDDGVPVSTVMTSVVADAVCVWCMATPGRYGRRGFGRALLVHVLLEARGAGASTGLLGATPAGRPLYAATGWKVLEEWQLYLRNRASRQFSEPGPRPLSPHTPR